MSSRTAAVFDAERVRGDFPILARTVHGQPLTYLDNAATAQRPSSVLFAMHLFSVFTNANIHRGVHELSAEATRLYDGAREQVRGFLNAGSADEIIFTKGCTESLNLVASSYGSLVLRPGDEVVISEMEHHSNIVPWQMACDRAGAKIRAIPVTPAGELDLDAFRGMLSERTKVVSIVHVSNALGTVNPVREISAMARGVGATVVVDGAQAAPHLAIDVQDLGADFYAIAPHKMYGPMGIGALYGRRELLAAMPPYQGGGDMIRSVSLSHTEYAEPPARFEAGTPNVAGAVGLGAAIEYLGQVAEEPMRAIGVHERELLAEATERLEAIPGVTVIGKAREKAAVLSFVMDCAHPHDIGTILDSEGVAVRAGHHCCMPLMTKLGLAATARASFGIYNTSEDVDRLAQAVLKVREVFA